MNRSRERWDFRLEVIASGLRIVVFREPGPDEAGTGLLPILFEETMYVVANHVA
jgi:hypothetical protein